MASYDSHGQPKSVSFQKANNEEHFSVSWGQTYIEINDVIDVHDKAAIHTLKMI